MLREATGKVEYKLKIYNTIAGDTIIIPAIGLLSQIVTDDGKLSQGEDYVGNELTELISFAERTVRITAFRAVPAKASMAKKRQLFPADVFSGKYPG